MIAQREISPSLPAPVAGKDVRRPEPADSQKAHVTKWLDRIKKAKARWEKDFCRMRKNIEFATGIQWDGQTQIDSDQYVCNLTLQIIQQKVAQLYAKNPQVEVIRRERLDFELWDERLETLQAMLMRAQQAMLTGIPDVEAEAVLVDYQMGRERQEIVDKICKTGEIVYQYQVDAHKPDYKEQLKQLVTRVSTCGVAYARVKFVRENDVDSPSTVEVESTVIDRAKIARAIVTKIEDGDVEEDSAEMETLKSLMFSIQGSLANGDEAMLTERLEWDFPPATSIIPDVRCRSLKEFIAARFIAQEYLLPLDDINAFFGTSISPGGDLVEYGAEGVELPQAGASENDCDSLVCLWEVFDRSTKTRFFLVDGYEDYVLPPEPLDPPVAGFWPLCALSFNNLESDPRTKSSIFPPSDVDLVRHAQKEWNRTRDALRAHRNANAPIYVTYPNILSLEDKERIRNAQPHQVIELTAVTPGTDIKSVIQVLPVNPVDERLYDTTPLAEDIQLGARVQEANIGPAQPDVTATVGTIAEQSRQLVAQSNVDDLDSFLSRLAQMGFEMLLRGMSPQTVKRIAGVGAAWPTTDKEDYLNEIAMQIVAGSSGRPNQALEAARYERLAPLLMSAGANPQFLVEEGVRRLDERIPMEKAFPLVGGPMGVSPAGGSQPAPEPQQPLQDMPAQAQPVGLPAS